MNIPKNHALWQVSLPRALPQCFDYWAPEDQNPVPGCRVRVPFGRTTLVGVLLARQTHPPSSQYTTKTILELLDTQPLWPNPLWGLLLWAARYYQTPLGLVWPTGLPKALRQGKPVPEQAAWPVPEHLLTPPHLLREEQQVALTHLRDTQGFGVHVLEGITGSGKTEVYSQWIAHCVAQGGQALVLVPEIALTPQTAQALQKHADTVAIYHSQCTDAQRLKVHAACAQNQIQVVVGTRSALFLPFANLQAVVVDEEHDPQFKQQDSFPFHGRDLAIKAAQLNDCPIVLASATLSLETRWHLHTNKYQHLKLSQRCNQSPVPQMRTVDPQQHPTQEALCGPTHQAIAATLARGEQVMILLNRKGYAPVCWCSSCQTAITCPGCDKPMVCYKNSQLLQCHHCHHHSHIPEACPQCQSPALKPLGWGTERLVDELAQRYRDTTVLRMDANTLSTPKKLQEALSMMATGEPMVVVGTQLLAKGHHFPKVTLVVILGLDQALFSLDFRSLERMGQLITQVAGRSGRGSHPGQVLLQSRCLEHPHLKCLLSEGFVRFSEVLLQERAQHALPPHAFLVLIHAQSKDQECLEQTLTQWHHKLTQALPSGINVWGPMPALQPKNNHHHRMQIMLHSPKRALLHERLRSISHLLCNHEHPKVRWHLDVDPLDLY